MTLIEKFWILISISIIFIILSNDPKSSMSSINGNPLLTIFSSASEGQEFIHQFNWMLITVFFMLTVSLSYFA
jgi:protein translocase SecG subunit